MFDFDNGKQSNQLRYSINFLVCRLKLLFYIEFHFVAAEDHVFCIILATKPPWIWILLTVLGY